MTTTDIDELEKRWAGSDSSNSNDTDPEPSEDEKENEPTAEAEQIDEKEQPVSNLVMEQQLENTEGQIESSFQNSYFYDADRNDRGNQSESEDENGSDAEANWDLRLTDQTKIVKTKHNIKENLILPLSMHPQKSNTANKRQSA